MKSLIELKRVKRAIILSILCLGLVIYPLQDSDFGGNFESRALFMIVICTWFSSLLLAISIAYLLEQGAAAHAVIAASGERSRIFIRSAWVALLFMTVALLGAIAISMLPVEGNNPDYIHGADGMTLLTGLMMFITITLVHLLLALIFQRPSHLISIALILPILTIAIELALPYFFGDGPLLKSSTLAAGFLPGVSLLRVADTVRPDGWTVVSLFWIALLMVAIRHRWFHMELA